MKKVFLLFGLVFLLAGTTMAGQADLFSYDKEALAVELADLTNLENYVAENPGITMTGLQANNNALVSKIQDSNATFGFNAMNEQVLGIGGLWWGCCLGPVGVLVVWLGADDPSETRKSIIGCIISSLLGSGGGILFNGSL